MFPRYLVLEKTGSQLFRAGQTLLQLFKERKKWIPGILRLINVVHNCQEQEKRLLHLFKVRKAGSQQLGARKKCFPAIWKWKKLVPSYFEHDKHSFSYLEREKVDPCDLETKNVVHNGQKHQKDYDIYLKSEKLVHSNQEHEKIFFQPFGSGKNWFLAISTLKYTVAAI